MPTSPNPSKLADGVGYAFFLLPDTATGEKLQAIGERLQKAHRIGGTPIPAASLHMPLCPMGRAERLYQTPEQALLTAGAAVQAQEFTITLDSAMRMRAHDAQFPLVLCTDAASTNAIQELRRAIAVAQAAVGLQVPGVTGFTPYLALLQGETHNAADEPVSAVQWLAREFVLVRRFFGGLRHEVIGRWALQPRPAVAPVNLLDELANLPDFPHEEE